MNKKEQMCCVSKAREYRNSAKEITDKKNVENIKILDDISIQFLADIDIKCEEVIVVQFICGARRTNCEIRSRLIDCLFNIFTLLLMRLCLLDCFNFI